MAALFESDLWCKPVLRAGTTRSFYTSDDDDGEIKETETFYWPVQVFVLMVDK